MRNPNDGMGAIAGGVLLSMLAAQGLGDSAKGNGSLPIREQRVTQKTEDGATGEMTSVGGAADGGMESEWPERTPAVLAFDSQVASAATAQILTLGGQPFTGQLEIVVDPAALGTKLNAAFASWTAAVNELMAA